MNINLSRLQETVKDRETWYAAVLGVAKSQLATEQRQQHVAKFEEASTNWEQLLANSQQEAEASVPQLKGNESC